MEIIEIRNNLVKLTYSDDENPRLGQFVAFTSDDISYVGQYVNLKADNLTNFAVAKLIFTFNQDGIVNEYDGSIPNTSFNIVNLPVNELLDLLPIENPVKVAPVSGENTILSVDISLFEHNFTVFANNDIDKSTVISNFVRQLFRIKEKSVVIDCDGLFADYRSLSVGKDFKLPLNKEMIDYIFEYDLRDVDNTTKATIQDIFSAVSQYIDTLDNHFLPLDSFIKVVTSQYKETKMPELALLKNKLLKYQEKGIFADTAEEIQTLNEEIINNNCVVVNIKNIHGELQKEIITYIHKILDSVNSYVYYFVSLYDDNSDKKLIKRLVNNSHIFTTVFAPHSYKYASELKNHAQDMLFFAPQDLQHDFAAYNTFLNKLNPQECVMYGVLTQGIPMILSMQDMELDLTKDDVFGDRSVFVPEQKSNDILTDSGNMLLTSPPDENVVSVTEENTEELTVYNNLQNSPNQPQYTNHTDNENIETKPFSTGSKVIQPVENIMADDYDDGIQSEVSEDDETVTDIEDSEPVELTEEDLDFIENSQDDEISEDMDLDMSEIEMTDDKTEEVPVVPVYTPEEDGEEISGEEIGFSKGDKVNHPRYGTGIIEKIIKYGNKTICSIAFDNVGRRLLDPSVTDFEKI